MAQTVFRCPTGMPTDLLAAWHDHTLSTDQTANVSAHITDCPACQAYLSDYAQADTALRRAEAPALQERIWRGLRADIAQSPRRAGLPRPAVLGGLGAALAVTILFAAFFVFVLDNKGTTRSISIAPSATASAIPTNTVIPSPTVTPLQVSPSQGWVTATALTYGKDIAFSQSEPLTGYACGNYTNDSSKLLLIGVTRDGGRTWQGPLTTPVTGLACEIFINPLNSQEIILEGQNCLVGCDGNKPDNYHSRDGGQTWTRLTLPSGDDPDTYIVHPVWSGGNLFVQAQSYKGISKSPHALAESLNGGALVWINQNGLPVDDSKVTNHIACAFAIGATYYICISPAGDRPLTAIASTNDNGATWSLITPASDNPLDPNVVAVGGDGKTLFSDLERSTDSGLTWKKLPETQGKYIGYIDSAPDGTVYAEYQNTIGGNNFFIKLLPGSQTWLAVASGYFLPNSLSWDASGHPVALWAVVNDNSGYPPPGMEYHAA